MNLIYGDFVENYIVCVLVTQSCLTLCDLTYCSLPDSSFHGILWARILEWIAVPFSRGSSWPRDWAWISCIACGFFIIQATREVPKTILANQKTASWRSWKVTESLLSLPQPTPPHPTKFNSHKFTLHLSIQSLNYAWFNVFCIQIPVY